ncbi:MAG: T9SS type A sorting domain-containing protein [Candidatus Aegiribacteria sp.]|nr:T9SS type A sorting domain-containing protein [Candidatus Aegiribacteria sp.]
MFIKYSARCAALFSAALFCSVPAMAESSWLWQHPTPTGATISSIHFIDDNRGWISTDLGEVFRTEDGGSGWELCYMAGGSLNCVFFLNEDLGWACGEDGLIIRTLNGGETWMESFPTTYILHSIEFSNENYGTVTGDGGTIMRTPDGGASWYPQGSGTGAQIWDVSFIDSSVGWTTDDYGSMLYTETGGAFWIEVSTGFTTDFKTVHFSDYLTGWTAGKDRIIGTADGGSSWQEQFYLNNDHFREVDFSGSSFGAAAAELGIVITENGGTDWQYEYTPLEFPCLYNVFHTSVSVTGALKTFTGTYFGLIFGRSVSGEWEQLSSHITLSTLNSIFHCNEYIIWACGDDGVIMNSSDGGGSWTNQSLGNNYNFKDICFPDNSIGYVCGWDSTGVIFRTTDGGFSWQDITPSSESIEGMNSLDFASTDCGVAAGNGGQILCTTDGGDSWTEKTGFSYNFTRVRFGDDDRGWIVGHNGKIVCFDFASDSWSEQPSPMPNTFYALFPLNSDTVWATGWNGRVCRTFDTGNTWEIISETGNDYSDVWFADDGLHGYFAGNGIDVTTDGGETIYSLTDPLGPFVQHFSFIDVNNGWGCGWAGRILSFADNTTGITEPDHSIPTTPGNMIFSSPNPFTTYSTVSFTLPAECHVALDMYDLAGRKVQTLYTGNLSGGDHSFNVNGTVLPPGIYYLRLNAGGITEMKPLIRIP